MKGVACHAQGFQTLTLYSTFCTCRPHLFKNTPSQSRTQRSASFLAEHAAPGRDTESITCISVRRQLVQVTQKHSKTKHANWTYPPSLGQTTRQSEQTDTEPWHVDMWLYLQAFFVFAESEQRPGSTQRGGWTEQAPGSQIHELQSSQVEKTMSPFKGFSTLAKRVFLSQPQSRLDWEHSISLNQLKSINNLLQKWNLFKYYRRL